VGPQGDLSRVRARGAPQAAAARPPPEPLLRSLRGARPAVPPLGSREPGGSAETTARASAIGAGVPVGWRGLPQAGKGVRLLGLTLGCDTRGSDAERLREPNPTSHARGPRLDVDVTREAYRDQAVSFHAPLDRAEVSDQIDAARPQVLAIRRAADPLVCLRPPPPRRRPCTWRSTPDDPLHKGGE